MLTTSPEPLTDPTTKVSADSMNALLQPRSIALVGASAKPGSYGNQMLLNALWGGFQGKVFAVNPGYCKIDALPCYPALDALPQTVEHVVLSVANQRLESAMTAAIEHGAQAVTIFASCLLDGDTEPPLAVRLRDKANEAGVRIFGGNGMGFHNFDAGLHIGLIRFPSEIPRGSVTLISQSGSVFGALSYNERRFGFNLCVSSGAELNTSAADYLGWALSQRSTQAVGMFLESVRDAERFEQVLAEAATREVPIVILKSGRTAASAAMARTHTGALAGDDAAYEALFERYGVARVYTLDELAATLLLAVQPRRPSAGALASIHDSGGECELILDLAADVDVQFGTLSEDTKTTLRASLDAGLEPSNPLDCWGTGLDIEEQLGICFQALMDDSSTAIGLFVFDVRNDQPFHLKYMNALERVAANTSKPVALATNFSWLLNDEAVARMHGAGIPFVGNTREALLAVKHNLAYRDFLRRDPIMPPAAPSEVVLRRWRERLASGVSLDAMESFALLKDFGIRVPEMHVAGNDEALHQAARRLGFPLVLKTANKNIAHKADVGGVVTGIMDQEVLSNAYAAMSGALGPEVVLMEQASAGVEANIGITRDAQFGPLVMVGTGGVLIELIKDRAVTLAPCDAAGIERLCAGLVLDKLLGGVRGAPPADRNALFEAAAHLSVLADSLGKFVDSIDVNPVIVTPHGAIAVDALVVLHSDEPQR